MRVHLGSDHAGFALKEVVAGHLRAAGHDVVDCGAATYAENDDYPAYCIDAATRTAADPQSFGIVLGGSGNGEAIAANKVRGVRAALCASTELARLAREHNDANVLSLGARFVDESAALAVVDAFLATPFSGTARHVRRIAQITTYEAAAVSG